MKKSVLALALTLVSIGLYAQELKFSDVATATEGRMSAKFTSYVASDGATYKIGDRIKIGTPSSNKTFAYVMMGDGVLLPIQPLTAASSNTETEIKKILVQGTKRAGYKVFFVTKGMVALIAYRIDFESSLATGEVKGFGKSSDDALTELKKAKDKLDLGLISQDEYDKAKTDLSKYIK